MLYLGEIYDDQRSAWCTAVAAFDEEKQEKVQSRPLVVPQAVATDRSRVPPKVETYPVTVDDLQKKLDRASRFQLKLPKRWSKKTKR